LKRKAWYGEYRHARHQISIPPISTLTEATQIDATRDVIWARPWAMPIVGSALKQTDRAEKTKRLEEAVVDYQKAVDIKQKAMETKKTPDDTKQLAAYYQQPRRGCRKSRQGR